MSKVNSGNPERARLTRDEVASIMALSRAGKTQTEIAQTLGCNISSVNRWLTRLSDSTDLAKQTLKGSALTVAQRLVKTTHAPTMLEILRDLKVSEKQAPAGESRGGVTVVIGVQSDRVQLGGFACSTAPVSVDIHKLTEATESDN